MGTLYTICNTVTKRVYVGRSECAKGHRVHKHFEALRHNRHKVKRLQEEYNKYGEESFVVNYLGEYSGYKLAQMECFMMKVLRSQDPRYGYNYKDRIGTSPASIEDKWRTPPIAWRTCYRLKREERRDFLKEASA